jgi:beta-xylosidase
MIKLILTFCVLIIITKKTIAQNNSNFYINPIIHADYSDPDVIRVGKDYYMVASSFSMVPGLPILHSTDLVNWKLIGHALNKLTPINVFATVQQGGGIWAPSIRYHNNEFYIFYPDPDFGIYVIKSKKINGPWSFPKLVQAGKGLIDPCPLWDDDGKVYLAHAYAGSRAGFKSILVIKEMNIAADTVINNGVMVYDGHVTDPTIEGPKLYKRNGYYYLFAPAGGVSTGWQLALRSKNIYGPYERKVVLQQGSTTINGPHQGAWINTPSGEDWFIHFQDKGAYGRITHLQPMHWKNDFPIIGIDNDSDGIGEPVLQHKRPNVGKAFSQNSVDVSDEFNSTNVGLQLQWHANPQEGWAFPTPLNYLTMYSVLQQDTTANLWNLPNILSQKFPAESFETTLKFTFNPKWNGEKFGFIVHGLDYAYIAIEKINTQNKIIFATCKNADKGTKEIVQDGNVVTSNEIYFKLNVLPNAICQFSYSTNGTDFKKIGNNFVAKEGKWIGAKFGMFFNRNNKTNDSGYASLDWRKMKNY